MKRFKGFTLIELLIVVAIIAILAAIAVPNFLEAQIRSKVSRVKADQRSMATALEAYYVDNNMYPAWAANRSFPNQPPTSLAVNVNYVIGTKVAGSASQLRSYALARTNVNPMQTLTTPIAYITNYPSDPFMSTKGGVGGFYSDAGNSGWILYSVGPDTDEADATQGDLNETVYWVYRPYFSQPSLELIVGPLVAAKTEGAYTYDPTNGTNSWGDVYRVKQ